MTAEVKSSLVSAIELAASQTGLTLESASQSTGADDRKTTVFLLGLKGAEAAGKTLKLELSDG